MPIRAISFGALVAAWGGLILLTGCSVPADSHAGGASSAHARAAQRIVLEPATHLPVAAQVADDTALTSGSGASPGSGLRSVPAVPEEVRLPDGTVGVKVAQQYFHTIVVCRQPDGSFSTQCPTAAPGARP